MATTASAALPTRLVRGVERRVRGGRLAAVRDPQHALHELLGAPWPCPQEQEFELLWPAVVASLRDGGLMVGRGCYGGWDDADPAFARAAWCLTRHLRPQAVVETGVARGLSSRIVLEALRRNDGGRLWSIDLPPSARRAPGLADETGAAVPPELRGRWTLLRGTSRHHLRGLLERLDQLEAPVGLFIHDSLHTTRNVRFELACVWPRLAPGGAALVDDVEQNSALKAFRRRHPHAGAIVCDASDGRAQFACVVASSRE